MIPAHVMREQQATLRLEGSLDKPQRILSMRSGESRFQTSSSGGSQYFRSLQTDPLLSEQAREMADTVLARLESFRDMNAELKVQIAIRKRRIDGLEADHQQFSGYWGSLNLPDAWPAMFGGRSGQKMVFRRGPWEQWPAKDLKRLEQLNSGPPLVFSPYCATLFHETVGHAMEAEYLEGSPLESMMGSRLGCRALNMADRPDLPGYAGSMTHDDCGRPASETSLVYRGFLVGDLGHANGVLRRGSYRDRPLIRATNFLIGAGRDQHESWLQQKECYYVAWIRSGNWKPGTDRIKILTGPLFLLRHGTPVACKDWAVLELTTADILGGISAVGSDHVMDPLVHWCVKQNQAVPISMGAPSLLYEGGWQ